MKITIKNDAKEIAALWKLTTPSERLIDLTNRDDALREAFKKMTLEHIKQLEFYAGREADKIHAVRECFEVADALEV